jgi:hypothetical protein
VRSAPPGVKSMLSPLFGHGLRRRRSNRPLAESLCVCVALSLCRRVAVCRRLCRCQDARRLWRLHLTNHSLYPPSACATPASPVHGSPTSFIFIGHVQLRQSQFVRVPCHALLHCEPLAARRPPLAPHRTHSPSSTRSRSCALASHSPPAT